MENREELNRIPCLVNEGTLFRVRDMIRILHDIGQIRYQELYNNQVVREGEGYVMGVFASNQSATMFLNRRVYINVKGFDHLKVLTGADGKTVFELVGAGRTIRMIPQDEPVEADKNAGMGLYPAPIMPMMDRGFGRDTAYDLLFEDEMEDIDEEL